MKKVFFFFFYTYFLLLFNLRKHDDISSPIHPGYRLNISVYTLAGGGSTLAIVILSCEITQYRNLIKIFVVIKIKMKNCGDLLWNNYIEEVNSGYPALSAGGKGLIVWTIFKDFTPPPCYIPFVLWGRYIARTLRPCWMLLYWYWLQRRPHICSSFKARKM